jgi:hypothetical protein
MRVSTILPVVTQASHPHPSAGPYISRNEASSKPSAPARSRKGASLVGPEYTALNLYPLSELLQFSGATTNGPIWLKRALEFVSTVGISSIFFDICIVIAGSTVFFTSVTTERLLGMIEIKETL